MNLKIENKLNLEATLMVRGVVTSDGLPVSAVAANFLIQYPLAPGAHYASVVARIKAKALIIANRRRDVLQITRIKGCH